MFRNWTSKETATDIHYKAERCISRPPETWGVETMAETLTRQELTHIIASILMLLIFQQLQKRPVDKILEL